MTVAEELAKLAAHRGLEAEVADAAEDLAGPADEAVTWRLAQMVRARDDAVRSQKEDRTEYDTGANGARISKRERDAFSALIDQISFDKPRR
jgi:DNA primase